LILAEQHLHVYEVTFGNFLARKLQKMLNRLRREMPSSDDGSNLP